MPADLPADFELLPSDSGVLTPDEEIAALVFPNDLMPPAPDTPQSWGSTWLFDFQDATLVRYGGSPVRVTGLDAAVMCCHTALRIKRFESPLFSDDAGMEEPDRLIGHSDIQERKAQYMRDVHDTLLAAHERVSDVTNFRFDWDTDDTVAYMDADVLFDNGEIRRLEGVALKNTHV